MELHARLVHLEADLRVVEVRATEGELALGSALAEAATVQDAEAMAVERLLKRLHARGGEGPALRTAAAVTQSSASVAAPPRRALPDPPASQSPRPSPEPAAPDASPPRSAPLKAGQPLRRVMPQVPPVDASPSESGAAEVVPDPAPVSSATASTATVSVPVSSPVSAQPEPPAPDPGEEPPADPEDWGQELAALDLQLRRLGWGRDQEGTYLQRAFGHPSRSRLTRYSDLRAYLLALEGLERGSDPAVAAIPLRRSELLAQGDALLSQLGWSAEQGRTFLERELQRVSRQQLSDVQLLQFNMLLEGELIEATSSAVDAVPGPEPAGHVSLQGVPA